MRAAIGDYVKVKLWMFKKPTWWRVIGKFSKYHITHYQIKSSSGLTTCHHAEIRSIDNRRKIVYNVCKKNGCFMWRDTCSRTSQMKKCRMCKSKAL